MASRVLLAYLVAVMQLFFSLFLESLIAQSTRPNQMFGAVNGRIAEE